jgi:hypothetical protein
MREALGQPLTEVSNSVLNKIVSKEVAMDLRKYKNNPTGSKVPHNHQRSKSKSGIDDVKLNE